MMLLHRRAFSSVAVERVDAVVAGGGVIGLAIGRALAMKGREVLLVESASSIGQGNSSRNSEVIHAGLYYPTNSLRAKICVTGRDKLYHYLRERNLPHRQCGKLIVATSTAEIPAMETLHATALANGVSDVRRISLDEAREMEPAVHCVAAMYSPSTGIIDSHAYMTSLQGDLENSGGVVALKTPVMGGAVEQDGTITIETGGEHPMVLRARTFVNCTGIHAPALARRMRGVPTSSIPKDYLAKGNYYVLQGKSPFRRLVYPMPEKHGLGVHVTLDLAGQARFGPDVEWVTAVDYTVDPKRAEKFYPAIRKYWPGLPDGALQPGYAGMRPKISGPSEKQMDFLISGEKEHGIAGLINMFGIESPGLTASLALADEVVSQLANQKL